MDFTEKTILSERLYTGKIVNIRVDEVCLHDGRPATREVCEHPGGVAVLPMDGDGNIIMVRQFRYPFMEELLEIPAGKLNYGEDPEVCGLRELREETGYIPGEFISLGCIYPSPGFLNEIIYLYLARKLVSGVANPDEDEHVVVERLPLATLLDMITHDKLRDAKTIAAIVKVKLLLGL